MDYRVRNIKFGRINYMKQKKHKIVSYNIRIINIKVIKMTSTEKEFKNNLKN